MSEQQTEQEIQVKGKTAPRVTPAQIDEKIVSEYYFTAGQGVDGEIRSRENAPSYSYEKSLDLLTFCVLVLENGFTVTGESACASPGNFDAEIGKKIAKENARAKIWPLLGFLLRQKLHDESNP